jgi:hypothetical protein
MAQVAKALATWKIPTVSDKLPEGITVDTSKKTVGKKPDRIDGEALEAYKARVKESGDYAAGQLVEFLRVAPTTEGVRNAIAFLSENGPGKDYGIAFTAAALNSALQNHVSKLTPTTAADSLSFVPPVSEPRYVDRTEVASQTMAAEYRAKVAAGEKMSDKDIAARWRELMGG